MYILFLCIEAQKWIQRKKNKNANQNMHFYFRLKYSKSRGGSPVKQKAKKKLWPQRA